MPGKNIIHAGDALKPFRDAFRKKHMFSVDAARFSRGLGVTLIHAVNVGNWHEGAHYHHTTREVGQVLTGCLLIVSSDAAGNLHPRVCLEDESFTIEPNEVHAIYVPAGTVYGTIRESLPGHDGPDYHLVPEMDQALRSFSPEILKGHLCDTRA